MKIDYGNGRSQYGPGVVIRLDGNEVAQAIDQYLEAQGVDVSGPRTINVNGALCQSGLCYVDPAGKVVWGGATWSGRGPAPDVSTPGKADSLGPEDIIRQACTLTIRPTTSTGDENRPRLLALLARRLSRRINIPVTPGEFDQQCYVVECRNGVRTIRFFPGTILYHVLLRCLRDLR